MATRSNPAFKMGTLYNDIAHALEKVELLVAEAARSTVAMAERIETMREGEHKTVAHQRVMALAARMQKLERTVKETESASDQLALHLFDQV
jgi:hypothetical protein